MLCFCTGHTQTNGAVSIAFTIETAPFFCVYPVFRCSRRTRSVKSRSLVGLVYACGCLSVFVITYCFV